MATEQPIDPDVLDKQVLAREADPELRGRNPNPWLDRLQTQHDQLNQALRWCLDHDRPDLGLEIAGAVWPFWLQRGHLAEGRQWLARLLATPAPSAPSLSRARSLAGAGTLAFFQGDITTSADHLQASLALFETLDYPLGIAEAHSGLSRVAMAQGQPDEMRRHSQAALDVARPTQNEAGIAIALHHLAHAALMDGNLDEAARLYAANIETYRDMQRLDLVVSELHNLGHVACLQGQPQAAHALFSESLRLGHAIGNHANQPYNLIGLGRVAVALGQPATAATLLGAGMAILRAQGKAVVPLLRPAVDEAIAATEATLSAEAYAAATERGDGLSTLNALALADSL